MRFAADADFFIRHFRLPPPPLFADADAEHAILPIFVFDYYLLLSMLMPLMIFARPFSPPFPPPMPLHDILLRRHFHLFAALLVV
jgi:hypothetical protein